MKRLFIALELPESLKKEILAWQSQKKTMPVRWMTNKNLHITIVPPWYSDDIKLITKKMEEVAKNFHPVKISMNKISFGPNMREPRLIWTEGVTPPELPLLKSQLEASLGQNHDPRPFLLHITLSRFSHYDFPKMPIKTLDEKIDWRSELSALVLMESHLTPHGADYEVLSRTQL